MATVLQLRFPGRRYHATPWGHHVNEGRIEWPPSPWRLLRSLLATGFTKLHWPAHGPPPVARRLVERLSAVAPAYALPAASMGHSRHYVDAEVKKPLIIDAWAQVDEALVEVVWDLDLPEDELELLCMLAEQLGYLGRAESWTLATVADRPATHINCLPDEGGPPGPRFESVRVLCATPAREFDAWRAGRVTAIEAEHQPPPGRSLTAPQRKKLDKALEPFPADLVAALCIDTNTLKGQGWSAAPGSREVLYWRPADSLSVRAAPSPKPARVPTVPFALLALATESRSTSALPPLHRVFPQGRLLHKAIANQIKRAHGEDPQLALVLLGRSAGGRAELRHSHAHLLHLDLDGDQRLDHVLVHVPMGLDHRAQEALRATYRTWMKGGAGDLTVALAGLGDAATFQDLPDPFGPALAATLGPAGGATRWVSATPYVAPRLLKRRGRDSVEGQVRIECIRRGLPEPREVRIRPRDEEGARRLRHYILHDATHEPPWHTRYALELDFDVPVLGPLCLGYGAHYGLGRFQTTQA